jgi:hypothetical protein
MPSSLLEFEAKSSNPDNPIEKLRHSGEGRNPVEKYNCEADQVMVLSHCVGNFVLSGFRPSPE